MRLALTGYLSFYSIAICCRHRIHPEVRMPFTLNGVGTRFYGDRDRRPDGSYVTTEFIVFLFIPILPLRSWRVRSTGTEHRIVYSAENFAVKRVPLQWGQVVNVYLGVLALIMMAGVMGETVRATEVLFPHYLHSVPYFGRLFVYIVFVVLCLLLLFFVWSRERPLGVVLLMAVYVFIAGVAAGDICKKNSRCADFFEAPFWQKFFR
jgi:hypothetical protein